MQSNTARTFGRSALIDSRKDSARGRTPRELRRKAIKFFVADPAAAYLGAEGGEYLADGGLTRDNLRKDRTNVSIPPESSTPGLLVHKPQKLFGEGDLDCSRHDAGRCLFYILPHG